MAGKAEQEQTTRAPLTARMIVDAALELADTEGLEAVSIRRIARQLGVTPMAMYWHVKNKDELLDGVAARILEDVDRRVDAGAGWQEQLRQLLTALLGVLRAHPAPAGLISTRTITSDHALRLTEHLLDILRRAGFSPAEATQVARHAVSVLANLVTGQPGMVARNTSSAQQEPQRARATLESLSPERYPRLVEAAAPLSERMDPETYFAFGLDLLLAGIEAMAARSQGS